LHEACNASFLKRLVLDFKWLDYDAKRAFGGERTPNLKTSFHLLFIEQSLFVMLQKGVCIIETNLKTHPAV